MPEDSAPKISVTLPFGIPLTPNARSKLRDPVDIESILIPMLSDPSLTIEPCPNCLSIWPIA